MKRNFVIDEEIDLFGEQKDGVVQEQDLLNTSTYVHTLTDCVMSAPENSPFTIGLFGEWGSGKSSIIKTFSKDIVEKYKAEKKRVKVIKYDAWKYANDSFRRMFLLQVQQDLGFDKKDLMNSFYLNSSEDAHIDTCINWKEIGIWALVVIIMIILIKISNIPLDYKITSNALVALLSLLYAVIRGFFKEIKVNIQKPHLFAPEQFEECFSEMCEKAFSTDSKPLSYLKYISGEKGESGLHKLVIVIDNVDRCSTHLAYELLTNIKNFLGQKYNIVFIIPVDEEALRKHIVKSDKDKEKESAEFLRKFFNICIRIKPFHQEEMYDFASGINKKYQLGLQPMTISLVANEFATNPRRIIQMFNNLQVELDSLSEDLTKEHQPLICKLLIIREEYPEFYKKLQRDAAILFQLDSLKDDPDVKLKRFLKNTIAVTSNYQTNLSLVERILTNSNVFDGIPEKVKYEYNQMEYEGATLDFVSDSKHRQDLMHYAFNQLEKGINRGLWDIDVKNSFDKILALNKQISFEQVDNTRLVNIISSRDVFVIVADRLEKFEELIDYVGQTESHQLSQFADWLTEYIVNKSHNEYSRRENVWYACDRLSSSQVKKLQPVIIKAIQNNLNDIDNYDYGEKSSFIFTDGVIKEIISQLEKNTHSAFQSLYYISKKIKYTSSQLGLIIQELRRLTPDYTLSQDNSDDIIDKVNGVTQILNACPDCSLIGDGLQSLKDIFEILVKDTRPNQTRSYTAPPARNLMKDKASSSEFVDVFLAFFKAASHNVMSVVIEPNHIDTLMTIGDTMIKEKVMSDLYTLLSSGYPIEKYDNIILSHATYSDNYLKLIDYLLKLKEKSGSYHVDDSKAKDAIIGILEKALQDKSPNKQIYIDAIERIAQDERNAKVLLSIFLSKDKDWLLSLPDQLLKYAIKAFETNISDYEDNEKVLMLLAKKGGNSAKKKVVSVIVKRLNSDTLSEKDLNLIDTLTDLDQASKDHLVSNLNYAKESHSTLSEMIDKCIKHLEKK